MNAVFTLVLQSDTIRTEIFHWADCGMGVSFSPKAALSPKSYSEINICVALVVIFVYLTAQLKSNADGCLSQTYTSLGVFLLLFFYLPASTCISLPWTPLLSTVKLINIFSPANAALLGERCDWQWKANNVVCSFCVHLSYLSDVNTQMVPRLFSTRHFMTGNKLQPSLLPHKFRDDLDLKCPLFPLLTLVLWLEQQC